MRQLARVTVWGMVYGVSIGGTVGGWDTVGRSVNLKPLVLGHTVLCLVLLEQLDETLHVERVQVVNLKVLVIMDIL